MISLARVLLLLLPDCANSMAIGTVRRTSSGSLEIHPPTGNANPSSSATSGLHLYRVNQQVRRRREPDPKVAAAEVLLKQLKEKRREFRSRTSQPATEEASLTPKQPNWKSLLKKTPFSAPVVSDRKLSLWCIEARPDSFIGRLMVKIKTVKAIRTAIEAIRYEGTAYKQLGKGLVEESKKSIERASKKQALSYSIQEELQSAQIPIDDFTQQTQYMQELKKLQKRKKAYRKLPTTAEMRLVLQFYNLLTRTIEKVWNDVEDSSDRVNIRNFRVFLRKWAWKKKLISTCTNAIKLETEALQSVNSGNREKTARLIMEIGRLRYQATKVQGQYQQQGWGKIDLLRNSQYKSASETLKDHELHCRNPDRLMFVNMAEIMQRYLSPDNA